MARPDGIHSEGPSRKRYATRAQRRLRSIFRRFDLSRLFLLIANVEQIERDGVEGAVAELGVWKGSSAAILHALLPKRELYLLDTFQGFDDRDVDERQAEHEGTFADTSVDTVRSLIGDSRGSISCTDAFPRRRSRSQRRCASPSCISTAISTHRCERGSSSSTPGCLLAA